MAQSSSNNELFSLARYREYLRALARTRLDPRLWSKVDPSEIVQEAMLKAYLARDQFRGQTEKELAAWLGSILNNTLANALRSCGRHGGFATINLSQMSDSSSGDPDCLTGDSILSPEALALHNEELLQLAAALERLPDDQRAVLEMKHLHGFSIKEICKLTNRTKPAVVGLLYRGIKTLRIQLDQSSNGFARGHSNGRIAGSRGK
jgi:RNA polymerase sigma-70 factor (ECF subfamily)